MVTAVIAHEQAGGSVREVSPDGQATKQSFGQVPGPSLGLHTPSPQ